jgi:hypothetical protein
MLLGANAEGFRGVLASDTNLQRSLHHFPPRGRMPLPKATSEVLVTFRVTHPLVEKTGMQKPGWNSSLLTTLLAVLPACGDPSSGVTEPGRQTEDAALSTPLPRAPSTSPTHGTTRIIVRYRDHAAARNTPSAAVAASRRVQETATRHGFHVDRQHGNHRPGQR